MRGGQAFRYAWVALAVLLACPVDAVWADDCRIQVSQPRVDYGSFNPHVLRANAKSSSTVSLGKRLMRLNIQCTDPKDMALAFRGVASGVERYKLSDEGEFEMTLKAARLDGIPVRLGVVTTAGDIPAQGAISVKLTPGKSLVPLLNQRPQVGKNLSVQVELDVRVFVEKLGVRDVASLETRGYFELN
jgi:hypothetical protein